MSWVTVAVTGFQVLNQINQGRYAAGQSELQAQQDDYQATVANHDAMQTAKIIRRAGAKQIGEVNTGYASAGVQVGEGSAGLVEGQLRQDVEHDAFQAILEGGRRARGFETDAAFSRANATAQRWGAAGNAGATTLAGGYQASRQSGWR